MRLIQILFQALFALFAVIAGLIAAAAVALVGSTLLLRRRLRRSPGETTRPGPRFSRRTQPTPGNGEIIDVTATEVPSREPPVQEVGSASSLRH